MSCENAPRLKQKPKAHAVIFCLKFTFQAYFKPYAMKQFSPLEKKAVKLSSF
ncbi:hypothetical protein H7D78_001505 [Campylobacter upsaliensis]|nr:hypothetical protein [Campylobacter upsaliensis]